MSAFLSKPAYQRFMIGHLVGQGFVVLDPEGSRLTEPTPFRVRADQQREVLQAEADRKIKKGARPCLCCGAVFPSEGIHNRLCNGCRGRASDSDPVRPVLPGRKSA